MATRQHPQPPNLSPPTSPTKLGLKQCYGSPLEGSVIEASTGQVITKENRAETAKYVFWFQSPCLFLLPHTGSSRCDEMWQQPHSLPLESRMSLWQELSNVFGKVVPGHLSSDLREYTYGDQELWQRYVSSSICTFQWSEAEPYFNALEKLALHGTPNSPSLKEEGNGQRYYHRHSSNLFSKFVSLPAGLPWGEACLCHHISISSAHSAWHTVVLERYLWDGWMRTTGLTTKL